jgi:hypothetical protein
MEKHLTIPADELAAFMNEGWPGVDWYLTEHPEYLWETTFTQGTGSELYRACQSGSMINLFDFEGRIRWQGNGTDPTNGRGYKLSTLFLRWQRIRCNALIVASVPHERLSNVIDVLQNSGCLLVYSSGSPRSIQERVANLSPKPSFHNTFH